MERVTLILLAHQDDEIGIYNELRKASNRNDKVVVIYLTSGSKDMIICPKRNQESKRVLSKFGVSTNSVLFLGTELGVLDGRLVFHLENVFNKVLILCKNWNVGTLIFHTWEGGHEDHDAVYLIGCAVGVSLGITDNSFHFPFYNGKNRKYGFRLFKIIDPSSRVFFSKVQLLDRIFFPLNCFIYLTQWRTMAILFLPLLFYNLVKKVSVLQELTPFNIYIRPHSGPLLYERRGRLSFSEFYTASINFVNQHIVIEKNFISNTQ